MSQMIQWSQMSQLSDDSSEPIRKGTSAALRKAIDREVRKALRKRRGKGDGDWDEFMEQLVTQERCVAKLELQSAQTSGESGLI